MPELPEVESYRLKLAPMVVGQPIESVKIQGGKTIFLSTPATLRRALKGQSILGIRRHGKYLLLDMEKGSLLVHLGMTGQIFSRDYRPDIHVHLTLKLRGAKYPLYYRDARKFGKILWLKQGDEVNEPRLTRLGPDALQASGEHLYLKSRKRKTAIKGFLLDQSIFAGIGNIYADEALFDSGIRPTMKAGSLTRSHAERLAASIRRILKAAVEKGGSSINDYIHPDGSQGYFQTQHQVYDRGGEACHRCGGPIKKIVVAQRGTHYCPTCQPARPKANHE